MGAGKPTQKFELNLQKDISEQIKDMKIDQLMRLFFAILNMVSISFVLMNKYSNEFMLLFKSLGKALSEGMTPNNCDTLNFDNMAEVSEKNENPFLFAFFLDSVRICLIKNWLGISQRQ